MIDDESTFDEINRKLNNHTLESVLRCRRMLQVMSENEPTFIVRHCFLAAYASICMACEISLEDCKNELEDLWQGKLERIKEMCKDE